MAIHALSTTFFPNRIRTPLTATARLEIERVIEVAIALLDQDDGDCDLEDDELGDDPLDRGEDPQFCETALIYGIDQSQGPVVFSLAERLLHGSSPAGRIRAD